MSHKSVKQCYVVSKYPHLKVLIRTWSSARVPLVVVSAWSQSTAKNLLILLTIYFNSSQRPNQDMSWGHRKHREKHEKLLIGQMPPSLPSYRMSQDCHRCRSEVIGCKQVMTKSTHDQGLGHSESKKRRKSVVPCNGFKTHGQRAMLNPKQKHPWPQNSFNNAWAAIPNPNPKWKYQWLHKMFKKTKIKLRRSCVNCTFCFCL